MNVYVVEVVYTYTRIDTGSSQFCFMIHQFNGYTYFYYHFISFVCICCFLFVLQSCFGTDKRKIRSSFQACE